MKKYMKKIIKSRIFLCILTGLVVGSLSAGAATYFASGDVSYDNSTSGLKSTDVQSAIDELYNECFPPGPLDGTVFEDKVVTSGDGLYVDEYEEGKYIYRGSNPNNYITFNDETWRIMSIEQDGTIKIVRNAVLFDRAYDEKGKRTIGGTYCYDSGSGCNIWGSKSTLYNASGSAITTLPFKVGSTANYTLPTAVSDLNTYLNGTYYNDTLSSIARNQIEKSWFNVGPVVTYLSGYTLSDNIGQSKAARWKGNIGLIDAIEYVKASTNSVCDSVYDFTSNSSCYKNHQNYLNISDIFWTLSPNSDTTSNYVSYVNSSGNIGALSNGYAHFSYGVRPALFLKSDITLIGEGTLSDPYVITN